MRNSSINPYSPKMIRDVPGGDAPGTYEPPEHLIAMTANDAVDGPSTRQVSAMDVGAAERSHDSEEPSIQTMM
jgi:hypothetical protein